MIIFIYLKHLTMSIPNKRHSTTFYWNHCHKFFILMILIRSIETCQDVSQISSKSSEHLKHHLSINQLRSTSQLLTSSTDTIADVNLNESPKQYEKEHIRIERSMAVLNENKLIPNLNNVLISNAHKKDESAGRYADYSIKPTSIIDSNILQSDNLQTTRSAKILESLLQKTDEGVNAHNRYSFLLNEKYKRERPAEIPLSPTTATVTTTKSPATASSYYARQNHSPAIQDIITGIVKLLNANVNVYSSTHNVRRPNASRINNRGPPRISEMPNISLVYDIKDQPATATSKRPLPYPFDRPFITGVPLPEQIIPYKPNVDLSSRPFWQRHKPRPPITSTTVGGRRPIQQYQPFPSSDMVPPQEVKQQTHFHTKSVTNSSTTAVDQFNEVNSTSENQAGIIDISVTSNDSQFSNQNLSTQSLELSQNDGSFSTASIINQSNMYLENHDEGNANIEIISETTVTTMPIQTTEEIEEVIFMMPTKTPELHTTLLSSSRKNTIVTDPLYTLNNTFKLVDKTISGSTYTEPQTVIEPTTTSETYLPTITLNTTTSASTTNALIFNSSTIVATFNSVYDNIIAITPTVSSKLSHQLGSTAIYQFQPRPGIVLDDPEFKPGVHLRPQRPPQRPSVSIPIYSEVPSGYGEIFDVTLSAVQGSVSKGTSQQTINIQPFNNYDKNDIILTSSGDDNFVSIDGKRTYINLFGDHTDFPNSFSQMNYSTNTALFQSSSSDKSINTNIGNINDVINASNNEILHHNNSKMNIINYAAAKVDNLLIQKSEITRTPSLSFSTTSSPARTYYRLRPPLPPVRIDTCIVGDDSTCDQAQQEQCKTENGISSCHCRPGYSRRKHREPCRRILSLCVGVRVDRIYDHRITWDNQFGDRNSEPYLQLSYEALRAIGSAMSMTPYSDEFIEATVNNIYHDDHKFGGSGVFVNLTIKLDENIETLRPNLRSDIQKHLLGVLHRRNNNIGNSVLHVITPEGAISPLVDLDECKLRELNDCHPNATCANYWGSFRCICPFGTRDPWVDQLQRAGRECQSCSNAFCNNHGTCSYNEDGKQMCRCDPNHYGGQCEIDGEVLGVAIGASVAAVVIIILTLICLITWSRRWQQEQKTSVGSVFGYMNAAPLKSAILPQTGYQMTLDDRMRWAQIADVMAAQSNHYGMEPIAATRPSSAMFSYPSIQRLNTTGNIAGSHFMQGGITQLQQTNNNAPPVPLPRRLGLTNRSTGMHTLENSSSSEEEDRTDLLEHNFHVPRPQSRGNGSIANQSGIYYDVDYEPSANDISNTSVDRLYAAQNQSNTHSHISNSHMLTMQGIPMSTYTPGRSVNAYYIK